MKFLCVACDEAMKLQETSGPERGSMTVLFGCPACGNQVAMLTNAMETQMVSSLGVKIGGRTVEAEPMEMVRTSLADHQEPVAPASAVEPVAEQTTGSKCPFTGMVNEAMNEQAPAEPTWTPEAEERMARIPTYVRSMVKRGVEQHARDKGYAVIDENVMNEVRGVFGM